MSQGVTTLNSLSATSVDLKSGGGSTKSVSSSVYASTTLPVQSSQTNIQQQQQQQPTKQPSNQPSQLTSSATQFVSAGSASNQVPITTVSASSNTSTLTSTSASLASRRKLPIIPRTSDAQQQQQPASASLNKPTITTNQINLPLQTNKTSQVLIQCWLDGEHRELVVSLVCAQLQRINTNAFYFGQVRVLPTL